MRLGRKEQWLLLSVLLAGAAWIGLIVYAKTTAAPPDESIVEEPAPSSDGGPTRARSPDAASVGGSEMVFTLDEVVPPGVAATAAPTPGTARAPVDAGPNLVAPPVAPSATIEVRSQPSGARLMDMGTVVGRTPMRFPRPTQTAYSRYLLVQKTGFRSVRIALTPTSPDRIEVTLQSPDQ